MPEKAPSFFFPYYTLLKTRPSKDSNFVWVSFSEIGVGDRESSIYTVKVAKNRQGGIMVAFSLPFSSLFFSPMPSPKESLFVDLWVGSGVEQQSKKNLFLCWAFIFHFPGISRSNFGKRLLSLGTMRGSLSLWNVDISPAVPNRTNLNWIAPN